MVWDPRVEEYQYESKKDGSTVTNQKFECLLVGASGAYCVGSVKGVAKNPTLLKEAKDKFKEKSIWMLSKVQFDTFTSIAYMSNPIGFRIDINKSTWGALTPKHNETLIASFKDTVPVQPRTVADVAAVRSARAMDIMALVKSISQARQTKRGLVADVVLIDGSRMQASSPQPGTDANAAQLGDLATIKVSVWGPSKIQHTTEHQTEPMVFFNLSTKRVDEDLQIHHWE